MKRSERFETLTLTTNFNKSFNFIKVYIIIYQIQYYNLAILTVWHYWNFGIMETIWQYGITALRHQFGNMALQHQFGNTALRHQFGNTALRNQFSNTALRH